MDAEDIKMFTSISFNVSSKEMGYLLAVLRFAMKYYEALDISDDVSDEMRMQAQGEVEAITHIYNKLSEQLKNNPDMRDDRTLN